MSARRCLYYVEFHPGFGPHAGNRPGYPASYGCALVVLKAGQFYCQQDRDASHDPALRTRRCHAKPSPLALCMDVITDGPEIGIKPLSVWEALQDRIVARGFEIFDRQLEERVEECRAVAA